MPTYFMFGKYSQEAVKGMSAKRTEKANQEIRKHGGNIISMYALLGEYDLAFIVDFPGEKEVMKASCSLNKLTGISFTTCPAITVEEFDRLISEI